MRNLLSFTTKRLFLIVLFFFCTLFVSAQNPLNQKEKLFATAKVWGFLKYYHPQVALGKYDWDQKLFDILPAIQTAASKEEFSAVIQDWIASLGEIPKCKRCDKRKKVLTFDENFDLSWTGDQRFFTEELTTLLKNIEKNRLLKGHHYVSANPQVDQAKVQNEKQYGDFDWLDEKIRLLALFRFWNFVEYFFPYKYQMDQSWDLTLEEMIPEFLEPKTEVGYHLALSKLVGKIDDSHGYFRSELLTNFLGTHWLPVKLRFVEEKLVVWRYYNDSLATLHDFQRGDVILSINGQSISEIIKEKEPSIAASNYPVMLRKMTLLIERGQKGPLGITYERDGQVHSKIVERYSRETLAIGNRSKREKWKILDGNIGYVWMGELEQEDVMGMMDSLRNTKGIIFDVRNYPKGTMYLIASYLMAKPKEFVKFTKPDFTYPGKYDWVSSYYCGFKKKWLYKGQVVLLFDENTQSHAEFTCMCLENAEGAVKIGSQTSAADGNVSSFEMVGGFKTRITGIGVFYPDGTPTQRVGIVPDLVVKPTLKGVRNNQDELLEKAIEVINEKE